MKKLLYILNIAVKNPIKILAKLNFRNFRTLLNALRNEDKKTISSNLKRLINAKPDEEFETPAAHPSQNITTAHPQHKPQPVTKSEKEFYSQWDDKYIQKHYDELSDFSRLESGDFKSVVFVADLNLPQCKKYRVLQKIEILKKKGIRCDFSHWLDVPRSLKLMQNASSVIFYRIPYSKLSGTYLDEALRLSLSIGYDIDDPIFDKTIYKSNTNLNFLSKSERNQLLKNTSHYVSLIRQCDFITTSTPFLKDVLEKYTKAPIHLWRNLMDSQSLNASEIAISLHNKATKRKNFTIGYMSGSRAHEADFEIAFDALNDIMESYENVHLHIVGYADIAKKLKFKKRITIQLFSDYYNYMSVYPNIDLNIIPLVINDFNECKSAIRYLESSLLSVPSIVTHVGDFKNIIDHKENGIFTFRNSQTEWYNTFKWCLENKKVLKQIGINANLKTIENYTTKSFDGVSVNEEIFSSEI